MENYDTTAKRLAIILQDCNNRVLLIRTLIDKNQLQQRTDNRSFLIIL